MKKKLLLLVFGLGLLVPAFAQKTESAEDKAKMQSMRLKEVLKLSDAQQKQIEQLKLQTARERMAFREKILANREMKRELEKKRQEEINAVLTAEQRLKIDAINARIKAEKEQLRADRGAESADIKALQAKESAEMAKILTDEQLLQYREMHKKGKHGKGNHQGDFKKVKKEKTKSKWW